MLYNFRNPYPDELLYSYLEDLARLNSLDFKEFLNYFIFPQSDRVYSFLKRYDSFYPIPALLEALTPYRASDVFLKTSIYPIISPFITDFERTLCIGKSFSDILDYKGIWPSAKAPYLNHLKLCPKCMKEDEETYGHWYYHRSHQVEGLELCPIHKTPLIAITHEDVMSLVKAFENETKEIYKNLLDASPSKSFSEKDITFQKDYGELVYLLSTLDNKLKIKWLKKLKEDEDIDLLLLKVRDHILKNQTKKYRNGVDNIKSRLFYLLTHSHYLSEDFLKDSNADYEIEKSLGDNIYLCKCKRCGKYFISTKILLDLSYTCSCSRKGKSREIILKEIFDHSFSNRFAWLYLHGPKTAYYLYLYDKLYSKTLLIRPFTLFSMDFSSVQNRPSEIKENYGNIDLDKLNYRISFGDNRYIFVCKTCETYTPFKITERYIGDCQKCETLQLIKESKKIVKEFSDEFEVLEDEIRAKRINIKHKSCGEIFHKELSILKKSEVLTCPCCSEIFYKESYRNRKIEKFTKEAKEILSAYDGEFELMEDDDIDSMRIPVIHKACGTVLYKQLGNLRRYNAIRCPVCKTTKKKK